MSTYNPYLAPQNAPADLNAPYAPSWATSERYVPLGWRTALATIGIAAAGLLGIGLDVSELSVGDAIKGESPDLGSALVVFFVAMAFLGALVFSAVFFGIWIHRASKNLRGLGRSGMKFSPAGCVGWYYVPFMNLVRPVRAMAELWRASDSDEGSDGMGWLALGTSTGLLGVWWGAWIVGNIITNISARMDDLSSSGGVGLMGSGLIAVAAVACILLMRGISSRQSKLAARLGVPQG
jgi:hypothetical protein